MPVLEHLKLVDDARALRDKLEKAVEIKKINEKEVREEGDE